MDSKQRRRLTVTGSDVPESLAADVDDGKLWVEGLPENSQAVSITSFTDKDARLRPSFENKDQELRGPPGTDVEEMRQFVAQQGIAYRCKKGMKPESPNQDSFSLLYVVGEFALYGVYDGHGPEGHFVSQYARQYLVEGFMRHDKREEDTGAAFTECFLATQRQLETFPEASKCETSGTTCTMVYHNMKTGTVTIAHAGDSRCVLGNRSKGTGKELTVDHKPELPAEKQRIESSNPPGRVVFDGWFNHRVFSQKGMYPGLNMSRALGDCLAHREAGLTAMPDVHVEQVSELGTDDFVLLICSDGVWEFLENDDAVKLIQGESVEDGVEKLCKEAYQRWMDDSDHEISDDISAIWIALGGK